MSPENEAIRLLEELGIAELPVIPTEICHRLEIPYLEQPLAGIDGMLVIDPSSSSCLISVNVFIREKGRKHYTYAHELGHYCMDFYSQSEFRCSKEDIESYKKQIKPIELRANRFAAELLLPRFLLKNVVDTLEPDWDHFRELADRCQTSLLAMAKRFVDLTDYSCVLIVSKDAAISWFCASKAFRLSVDMDSRVLSPQTVAGAVFQGKAPPAGFEVVKADNWLGGMGISRDTEILEWTLPMNSYGQVYSLLLDEDGIGTRDHEEVEKDESSSEWEPPTFHKSKRKR